jgi:hypothetical protein
MPASTLILLHGDSWFDYPLSGNVPILGTTDIVQHLQNMGNLELCHIRSFPMNHADLADSLFVAATSPAARSWRSDFRHDAIAVGDQDGFAISGETDIFAKLLFEDLQTD